MSKQWTWGLPGCSCKLLLDELLRDPSVCDLEEAPLAAGLLYLLDNMRPGPVDAAEQPGAVYDRHTLCLCQWAR